MKVEDYFEYIEYVNITEDSKEFMYMNQHTLKHKFENLNDFLTYINETEYLSFSIIHSITKNSGISIQLRYKKVGEDMKHYQYTLNINNMGVYDTFRKKVRETRSIFTEHFEYILKINKRNIMVDKLLDINIDI